MSAKGWKRLLAVAVLGIVAVCAYLKWKEWVKRSNEDFERSLSIASMRSDMHMLAVHFQEIWPESKTITNRQQLVELYNATSRTGYDLYTNGNPSPDVLREWEYFWLENWDLRTDGTNAPLLWTFAGRTGEVALVITISGQEETLDARLFRAKLHRFGDRVISTGPYETNAVPWWRRKVTNAENPNSVP
jgi:hypothetical protein